MIVLQWSMLVVGLVSGVFYAYGEMRGLMFSDPLAAVWCAFAYVLCRLGLVTFYIVVLLRLCLHRAWRTLLVPIAVVGRMPLSNYLLQTLMATFIFYGWGLGYWNRGTPSDWFQLAVALYLVVQIPLSLLWMARFKYGPMEYVWRVLTYGYRSLGQVPALAVAAPVDAAEVHADPSLADASYEPSLQPLDLPTSQTSEESQPPLRACEPPSSQTS
jgi:uncharacterized protein